MAYSTKSDLENAHGATLIVELTDDEASGAGNPEITTRVNRAIADADSMIDGHIRAHYDVPLDTTPDLIRQLSKDLAIWALYQRRAAVFELPEWLVASHKDAMELLRALRRGELDLGVEPPPSASSAEVADVDGPDRLFTDDTLEDF